MTAMRHTLPALAVGGLLLFPVPGTAQCTGDCNRDDTVLVNELVLGINIMLGLQPLSACPALADASGIVDVAQLIKAVVVMRNGCALPSPTSTASPMAATPEPTVGPEDLCQLKAGTCTGGPRRGGDCLRSGLPDCPDATCDLSGQISKIELNVAALPMPLTFALRGALVVQTGSIAAGDAPAACAVAHVEPINIPCIGFLCLAGRPLPCPPGVIECDGGAPLSIERIADAVLGACDGNAACADACAAHCVAGGAIRTASDCTGYCSGGAQQACVTDEACDAAGAGACNGPNPVGSVAGICQCECTDVAAGAPGRPGELQCNLQASLSIEAAAPCDGSDVSIAIGGSCIPMTTASSSSVIVDANFNPIGCPGGGSSCTVPSDGPALNAGNPVTCSAYGVGGTRADVAIVGSANFLGTALGDIVAELSLVCR